MPKRSNQAFAICILALAVAACGGPAATVQQSMAAAPSPIAEPSAQSLGPADRPLQAGTYHVDLNALAAGAAKFPSFLIAVPEGWSTIGGWVVNRPNARDAIPPVAVQFWDVDEVYGNPCHWQRTRFQPGPTVNDLVEAIADIPMRNATKPSSVTVSGARGQYIEWSVPSDLEVVGDSQFTRCDATPEGNHDFVSWTGKGWATDRYHQDAGQVDQLWILDVNGSRLVIDAFHMPYATAAERAEMRAVVESIVFEQ
jgi:hypothetical protein